MEPAIPSLPATVKPVSPTRFLVQARTGLIMSWANEPLLKTALNTQIRSMQRLEALTEKAIKDLLVKTGLDGDLKRCMKLEGIGFLTAARMIANFERGEFKDSDAFIVFLGLDPRVSQSGQKDGRRKLSKRGDGEARRLLLTPRCQAHVRPHGSRFMRLRAQVACPTQAFVSLARKLARVVFALLKNKTEYPV